MADVNFKTVRVLINNSTGDQDITISGFGTPKAAMFFYDIDTTDDTIRSTTRSSTGYTDGTNQAVSAISSSGNASTSATSRAQRNDAVILEIDTSSIAAQASFVQWVADGVRINISNASAAQRFCTVVLINGSDVTGAHVELSAQLASTTNDITSVGFEPDMVLLNCTGQPTSNFRDNHSIYSMGIALNDGTDKNFSVMGFSANGLSTTNTGQYTSNLYSCGQYFNDTLAWGGAVENYDSSGFNINTNSATGNDRVVFLALKFSNNPLIELTQEDSPTATGSKSFGSTSSIPSFNMFITGNNTTLDTGQSNLGYSDFVADSTNQYGTSYSSEDNVTTTNEKAISKSGGLVQLLDGAKQFDSTFTNFTATGADFNFTTVDATPRKWISLFIGDAASGGISITADSGTYTLNGTTAPLTASFNTTASSGNYNLTGTATGLSVGYTLLAQSGTYTLTGTNTNIIAAYNVIAETGTYNLTGTNVTLIYTPVSGSTLVIDSGIFTLTGTAQDLRADRKTSLDSGVYSIAGTMLPIKYNGNVPLDSGVFSYNGTNINLITDYGIIAATAGYVLIGSSVTLKYSGDVTQVIGVVTASFAPNTITSGYAPDTITSEYKPNSITVNFKG